MMVWPGCTPWPGPSSRKPILSRKKEDFAFPKSPAPSRSEIVGKLGEPDAWLPELRVACYQVNEVTKRNVELFFVIPTMFRSIRGMSMSRSSNLMRAIMSGAPA